MLDIYVQLHQAIAADDRRRAADASRTRQDRRSALKALHQGETPMINQFHRRDIAAARARIRQAVDDHDAGELETAAAFLDRILIETCPHNPETWETGQDDRGRELTTCPGCGLSWSAHPGARLPD